MSGAPRACTTVRTRHPAAAATAYSDPTCMIATGSPMMTSRRMPPPTAEQTPTKTAGTIGRPSAERLARAERAEESDHDGVERDDRAVEALEEAREQHAEDRGDGRGQQVPVVLQRRELRVQQQIADECRRPCP